jgi:hypothetical protein
LTPLYERLGAATITLTLTEQGKVSKVAGLKELLADALKDNPIAQQLAGGGSEEAIQLRLAEYFPALPDKAVTPGQRWEAPFQFSLDKVGKATGKRIYSYDGEGTIGKRKTAKISVTTELSYELDYDMGGTKLTGKLAITESKGTIHFDPKRGGSSH